MDDLLILSDDPGGTWHTPTQTFSERARTQLSGRAMTVILSGQSVRTLPHTLPALKARERMEAARFHAEPLIGEATDAAHIALGAETMSVISAEAMRAVLDALEEAGVTPVAIYADHEVLPPATLPDRIVTETATLDIGFPLSGPPPPEMDFAEALARFDAGRANDLLTGAFAPRRRLVPGMDRTWLRTAAGLAAAMGLGWGALQVAEARAERLQVEDLRARAQALYIEATGEASANPARDVARFESADDAAPDAVSLMAVLFEAVEATPGVSVDQLRYTDDGGQLDLRLVYPGFGATDTLSAAVARAGGRLSAGGVREQGGRFIGDAVLELER